MSQDGTISKLNLTGSYTWELLFDVDNTNNAGSIKREVEVKTSIFCSYSNMKKSLMSLTMNQSIGSNIGASFDIISIGMKNDFSYEAKSMYESMTETKQESRKETIKRDIYEVGPHSRLKLYRLVFNGPGITYLTDTLSSTPHDMSDVIIDCTIKTYLFLNGIDVVYTKDSIDRPDNLIQEISGKNPDINSGFGGDFVWLVAHWTREPNNAATGIQVVIQSEENRNFKDMAKGAGGDFRYIKILRDPYSNKRIKEVSLYRSVNDSKPNGWEHMTGDINGGRKGDYLHICWNSVSL